MIPVLFWALLSTAVAAAAPQITQEVVAQPNWGWPSAPTPSVWGALFYGLIAASLYILARASVSMGRGLARKGVLPFALRLLDGGGRGLSLLLGAWALLHLVPKSMAPLVSMGMAGAAVAVGWSLRGFAADAICGIGLLFGRNVRRDQHLSVDGRSGRVLRVGMFSTVLWSVDGQVVRIPNRKISGGVVGASQSTSMTEDVQVRLPVEDSIVRQRELLRNCVLLSPYVELSCAPEVWRDAQNAHVWHVRVTLGDARWGQSFRTSFRATVDETFSMR